MSTSSWCCEEKIYLCNLVRLLAPSNNPEQDYRVKTHCTKYVEECCCSLTSQNWTPRQLLPISSSGGLHAHTPITLGTTSSTAPATPDLAGRPTWWENEIRALRTKPAFKNALLRGTVKANIVAFQILHFLFFSIPHALGSWNRAASFLNTTVVTGGGWFSP